MLNTLRQTEVSDVQSCQKPHSPPLVCLRKICVNTYTFRVVFLFQFDDDVEA